MFYFLIHHLRWWRKSKIFSRIFSLFFGRKRAPQRQIDWTFLIKSAYYFLGPEIKITESWPWKSKCDNAKHTKWRKRVFYKNNNLMLYKRKILICKFFKSDIFDTNFTRFFTKNWWNFDHFWSIFDDLEMCDF